MNDLVDTVLERGLLVPPADFTERVIAALPARAAVERSRRRASGRDFYEWLAVGGAVVAGMAQLIPLLFGIWTFTIAG